ncbi:PTS fructose transporter subunit IIABC [Salimicrobium halophilum]|uniref:PTS system D-fructose-specific IIA component (F1P-forming), Frc family /PTS system D-fructose-specific IIB component (F1P-forming), Frc family /PTS system D-fructose-specific IIC component (F1P-for... n=1 Tax=Salimicrobium halophilum TaxID=86666 RepID=A0A1G8V6T1_9BACI|nr:PTS fructose transporter subunit IIABC [Salimicrobium halophilum]SDJ61758.1 PTS system D-fructose-specific IIA component (F1P-forming), Frc family /PTS system D-fructose-specific IIB component (F1P-forming), Frc family /PTS system D-fructose-specific IIC component (F1P-forming), Frc family [Salimicrobium halophilum]
MKITDLLKKDTMLLDMNASSKSQSLDQLADKLHNAGRLNDRDEFRQAIQTREEQSTTGVGDGIAIPHAKSAAVKEPAIAFGRSKEGIDYESLDNQPAHLFFMIAATDGADNTHLETLSRLSSFLMDTEFRKQLENATSEEEVMEIINAKEAEEDGEEETPEESDQLILAVTACPTGIAHTYMAADKLKDTAKQRNIPIKVQTNGSSGVKNKLTADDISRADAIIVAADTKVDMSGFDGKHVIEVPVAKAIHEPDKLLDRALDQDAPVYHADGKKDAAEDSKGRSGIYKHLMNGVSNMLPFVVGGGILIAFSFFFGINAANPDSDQYNPFAEMLSTIGGNAFFFLVPVLAGFIASSIADRPGFAPGMVGGYIAVSSGASDGGSGFLGGLIAGFLAGYLTLGVKKALESLPAWLDGLKTVLFYPVLAIFGTGIIMLVINPPLTSVYTGLLSWLEGLSGANVAILGIIIGGMMAVDMGGPVNKAAYTFGLATLDAGNYSIIAAAMAGGMVPPLSLALASTIFKNKFTKEEREAGKTAYALGACFITEGAIPFAAADPARVIPSVITGSALAGALTMLFGIGLTAPHGGIFVIGLVEGGFTGALLYIVAIVVGSIISAIMLGFLKKDLTKA